MSLILDALKKSEAERSAESDTIADSDPYSQDTPPQSRRWLLIVTSVLLTMGIGALVAIFSQGDVALPFFGDQEPPQLADEQAPATPIFETVKDPTPESVPAAEDEKPETVADPWKPSVTSVADLASLNAPEMPKIITPVAPEEMATPTATLSEPDPADDSPQEDPVAENAVSEQAVTEEPVMEEAVAEQPATEEAGMEEAPATEPAPEEAVSEEPAPEETVSEEPAPAEPVTSESIQEEVALATSPAPADDKPAPIVELSPPPQKPEAPEDDRPDAPMTALQLIERAQNFETMGRYEQAIDSYTRALHHAPDNVEAFLGRAWAHVTRQSYELAIRDFRQAISLSPDFANAHYGLGWAYEQNEQTALAIGEYGETIRLSPGHTNAAFSRGILELYDGHPEQAAEDFNTVYERESNDLGDFALLWLYVSGLQSGADASVLASSFAGKKSRSPWPGIIFSAFLGEVTYEQVIAATKDSDELSQRKKECVGYFFLGQHRLASGDTAGARDYFQKALETEITTYRQYWAAKIELSRLGQ